jgi:tetratricopeptide (TPR) repeat protein
VSEYRNPPLERKVLRILAPGLVLLALTAAHPAGSKAGEAPDPALHEGLALLHDGRFDEAEASFARSGGRPEAIAFFRAFAVYWRLLYDDENPSLQAALETRLLETISRAEEALARDPADPEATLFAGSARLLLGELRASQKKYFAAGSEAKKAKRLLEAGTRAAPVAADAAFGLGTYNYMADRLPAFVKGLRAILFLPGGDREIGLQQLSRAAGTSRYFRLEARILLSTIYASKHERLYADAEREVRTALAEKPRRVTALDAAARYRLMLAEPERAAELLDEAARRAAESPGTSLSVSGAIEYQRARADFAMLRPDAAQRRLTALLSRAGLPASLREDATKLADTASTLLASPAGDPWRRALPAVEHLASPPPGDDPLASLVDLARGSPQEPVLSLVAGRALLRAGRSKDALPLLLTAARSTATPRPLSGMSKLLAGQAADLDGQRSRALELYRGAIDGPSFVGRDAAYRYQRAPFRGQA